MRVCSTPGCPVLTDLKARGGRCPKHQRQADRARGTTVQRGYGQEHVRARNAILRRIQGGEIITCWNCGTRLDETFHLDHTDDRQGYRGPACSRCNLSLAGRSAR